MNKIKVSINLLCVLIISIVVVSTVLNMSALAIGFSHGAGNVEATDLPMQVSLMPQVALPDTITNDAGDKIPVAVERGAVFVPFDKVSVGVAISSAIANLLIIIAFIFLLFYLVKFIIGVNKGLIFVERNVKLLRKIGVCLLVTAIAQFASTCLDLSVINDTYIFPAKYSSNLIMSFSWADLVLGLVAFLMAEIWKGGLILQKESELTV